MKNFHKFESEIFDGLFLMHLNGWNVELYEAFLSSWS